VFFALVDANYNFLFVDVGCQGRISGGGVFANTELYEQLEANSLNLPQPKPLVSGSTKCIPYFIVGDEAFALTEYMMKPYPGLNPKGSKERIYNYRISRARRIVENVFGVVSSSFRVLRKAVLLEPEKAELMVMTIACLHNFLRRQPSSVLLISDIAQTETLSFQHIPGSYGSTTLLFWHTGIRVVIN
jgi:hypothetical protein